MSLGTPENSAIQKLSIIIIISPFLPGLEPATIQPQILRSYLIYMPIDLAVRLG